jgi:1-acyl-sn-glycerol-3-phosphate acyltransferase
MIKQFLSDWDNDDPKIAEWPATHTRLARAFEIFSHTVLRIYCPLTVNGFENLPKPPFLICSNHVSHMDSSMLMAASRLPFKKIGLIAAKDYFFDRTNRFYLRYMMNLVPIARGTGVTAIKDSIILCRSFLKSGGLALIIYPEGTRSKTGQIARFKEGAAIISHELNLPLVPACVLGSHKSLPKGSYFLRPKKVSVIFGRPIKVSNWLNNEKDRKEIFHAYREATLEAERQIRSMQKLGS